MFATTLSCHEDKQHHRFSADMPAVPYGYIYCMVNVFTALWIYINNYVTRFDHLCALCGHL